LVKGETWPDNRSEDKQFQRDMIDKVRAETQASAAHLKGMKDDVGQVRFRPVEVAGAVAADGYPADFEIASDRGERLRKMTEPPPPPQPLAEHPAESPPRD
jgi:hypothetical protein